MIGRAIEYFDSGRWTCHKHNETFRTERGLDKHFNLNHSPLFLYRCTECGKTSLSLGSLHSHIEKHTPWYSWGNFDRLMQHTEILEVKETEEVTLEEVKERGEIQ